MTQHRSRSSRQRYRGFLDSYKRGRIPDPGQPHRVLPATVPPVPDGRPAAPAAAPPPAGTRRGYVRNYLQWLRPHRLAIGSLFVLSVLGALLQLTEPLFVRFIIDHALLQDGLDTATRMARLHLVGALLLLSMLLAMFINANKDYRQRRLNLRLMLSLRRALMKRMLRLPLPALWHMKNGGILSRLTGDVDITANLLQLSVLTPALSVIRLAGALGVLLSLNWRLALLAMAAIPGAVLMSLAFSHRVRPIYRAIRSHAEQLDGRVGETFSGIRVVRAFGRETRELREYMRGRHTILRMDLFAHRRELLVQLSWTLLLTSINLMIVWHGGYLHIVGRASIGDILAFQWYMVFLLNPVSNIVNSFSELQRSLAAMERVFDVLHMHDDKPDRPEARDAPRVVETIRFEHVDFEYREGRPVIHDFHLTVRGGTVVALVGRSGAGKTTVTDLVARFHDPTRGRILLNDVDIRDLRLRTFRELLAIVQQDVFLFDGSVRENIAYGRQNATDAEIEDAARRANAHEFIERLAEQYDTFIGERGVKLSGGQKQRLAIARAILASPQILILDEATSNLDTESEELIQASMESLLAGRTTFVIAHRLSTIRRATLILLLDHGRVIERGTHDELMNRRGMYYEMVVRQMGDEGQADRETAGALLS